MSKLMYDDETNSYWGKNYTMQREDGKTPNDNNMYLKWVLRDSNGTIIDFDTYRNDLAERNNLSLEDMKY